MDLVAGPQGSGKSTFFPVAHRGHDAFNVNDRRRELNRGSSRKIPLEVRRRAIKEYDVVQVYDNSRQAQPEDAPEDITPQLVLEAQRGAITFAHPRPPRWLRAALRGTSHDLG